MGTKSDLTLISSKAHSKSANLAAPQKARELLPAEILYKVKEYFNPQALEIGRVINSAPANQQMGGK